MTDKPKVLIPADAILSEPMEVRRLNLDEGFSAIYDYAVAPCPCCGMGGRNPHSTPVLIVIADRVEVVK